jgi:glycosyltransferase involved in cell wall biosynthesis
MRVFMLGWEFPPFISGGLGTACYGLTKAMSGLGVDIMFVLPRPVAAPFSTHVRLVSPRAGSPLAAPTTEFRMDEFEHVVFRTIDAQMTSPYQNPQQYQQQAQPRVVAEVQKVMRAVPVPPTQTTPAPAPAPVQEPAPQPQQSAQTPRGFAGNAPSAKDNPYAGDMFSEIQRYAALAAEIARNESFDVVHAHDWMTFPAGLAVAGIKGVPLVVHVHSTEFDRSGVNVNQRIYDIERRGMHGAIKVVAVSYLTKALITHHYGVDANKVEVVYNAIETNGSANGFDEAKYRIDKDEKIVLFLGRITMQKGPEYFLAAAKKVLEVMENVKFVMAGGGDLIRRTIEMAGQMGIGHKVLFTGFLRGPDVERVFKLADLYVMPSVSEPFGIAPLEAMSHDVPVLISKQSGVSEVLTHALKVDFWDINEMANKIIAVLKHPPLASTLRQHGSFEVRRFSWTDAAKHCVQVYEQALSMMNGKR